MDKEPGRLQSMGLRSVRHNLVTEYAHIPYQPPRGSSFQCYGLVKALVLNHCLLNNFGSEKCNKIQSSFLIHLRLLDFQKYSGNTTELKAKDLEKRNTYSLNNLIVNSQFGLISRYF